MAAARAHSSQRSSGGVNSAAFVVACTLLLLLRTGGIRKQRPSEWQSRRCLQAEAAAAVVGRTRTAQNNRRARDALFPPPPPPSAPPFLARLIRCEQPRLHTRMRLAVRYLEGFRVEACPLFKQHQCQQHRPYTCFNWHFANQRRRRPQRRSDGSFNYSPDIYCDRYDENTGICPEGDSCPYLHRVSGDVERKYHLRYYKTAQCVHPTDQRGQCVKNGPHCAFAHSQADLRHPQHDTSDTIYAGCIGEVEGRDRTAFVVDDPAWNQQDHVLSCYKTEQCRKPARLCRQGYACPYFHNSKDRRRPPATFKYRSTPCPAAKSSDEWLDPEMCEQGDACAYCHTRTEQQFHPEIYKSTKCNDMLEHAYCPRAVFCAFAHHDSEMHVQRTPYSASTNQHSPKDGNTSDYRLSSPAVNGSANGININGTSYAQMIKGGQQIKSYSQSRDDLISSSYPKAPGFERSPLSPNYQADTRFRTYSLNHGTLDSARRAALFGNAWNTQPLATVNATSSSFTADSGFPNSALDELNIDLSSIDPPKMQQPNDLFSVASPLRQLPCQDLSNGPFNNAFNMPLASPSSNQSAIFGAYQMQKPSLADPLADFNAMTKEIDATLPSSTADLKAELVRWRNCAHYYRLLVNTVESEKNQLSFKFETLRNYLNQCKAAGVLLPQSIDFSTPPSQSFGLFGSATDDVWRPLPSPDNGGNAL